LTGRHLKALLIEDLSQDAVLIEREIQRYGFEFSHDRVKNGQEMKGALEKGTYDIILSDFNLPGFGANEALEILKKSGKNWPFIVVSGAIGEETAVELMKAGADDYVLKSNLDRLVPAIERSLRAHHVSLLAEQAQSSREHLLAVVSHDLKNPLGGVSLNLQVALKKIDDTSQASELIRIENLRPSLERALKSSQRMLQLIQGILDQTNIQSGKLTLRKERASASILIQELSDLFMPLANKNSIHFESLEESEECIFSFDFERVFQMLGNLLGNAIKFTPPGGKITLWYESSPEEVSFFVRDTGAGIPADQQPFIFKRFWQAKHTTGQGLGLGLSICRGIVESHSGNIQVFSNEGKGSTFQATLPRAENVKDSALRTAGKRILIIDDDESLSDALTDALRYQGFQVDHAIAAEEGLKLLSHHGSQFSLIVVDYNLPGMNGGQFAEILRSQNHGNSHIPIILCSAEPNLKALASSLPVTSTLSKPTDLADFVRLINCTLKKPAIPGISEKSIQTYLGRRADDLDSCRHALETSDYESIRSIAHRIKGSASTFGFPDLTELAKKLELAVSAADTTSIKRFVAAFETWITEHSPADEP
jgi:signal transduction histidine kinase/HPt (histidine-containing phosphotransfer) domain-containing protein